MGVICVSSLINSYFYKYDIELKNHAKQKTHKTQKDEKLDSENNMWKMHTNAY